jgi:hypothetical protein
MIGAGGRVVRKERDTPLGSFLQHSPFYSRQVFKSIELRILNDKLADTRTGYLPAVRGGGSGGVDLAQFRLTDRLLSMAHALKHNATAQSVMVEFYGGAEQPTPNLMVATQSDDGFPMNKSTDATEGVMSVANLLSYTNQQAYNFTLYLGLCGEKDAS